MNIDQHIEVEFRKAIATKVQSHFFDVEGALSMQLKGDEQAAAMATMRSLKARLVEIQYEKGIEQHKEAIVRRVANHFGRPA